MLKKNMQIGQAIGRKEMKDLKGGIGPCGTTSIYSYCTNSFNNSSACLSWALSIGAHYSSFNPANCQCCSLTYVYNECYLDGGGGDGTNIP
jgi:hypothetical protein